MRPEKGHRKKTDQWGRERYGRTRSNKEGRGAWWETVLENGFKGNVFCFVEELLQHVGIYIHYGYLSFTAGN